MKAESIASVLRKLRSDEWWSRKPLAERVELARSALGDGWTQRLWAAFRDHKLRFRDDDSSDREVREMLVEAFRRDPEAAQSEDVLALLRRAPKFWTYRDLVMEGWPRWAHETARLLLERDSSAGDKLEPGPLLQGLRLAAMELGAVVGESERLALLAKCLVPTLREEGQPIEWLQRWFGVDLGRMLEIAADAVKEVREPAFSAVVPLLRSERLDLSRQLIARVTVLYRTVAVGPLAASALAPEEWLELATAAFERPTAAGAEVAEACAIAALARTPAGTEPLAGIDRYLGLTLSCDYNYNDDYTLTLASLGAARLRALLRRDGAPGRAGKAYAFAALGPLEREDAALCRRWIEEVMSTDSGAPADVIFRVAGPAILPVVDEYVGFLRSTGNHLWRRRLESAALLILMHECKRGNPLGPQHDRRLVPAPSPEDHANPRIVDLWRYLPPGRLDALLELVGQDERSLRDLSVMRFLEESGRKAPAPTRPYEARNKLPWLEAVIKEAQAMAPGDRIRVYFADLVEAGYPARPGSLSRIGGIPPGFDEDALPADDTDAPLVHVATIDLCDVPELCERFRDARAIALFAPRDDDDDYVDRLRTWTRIIPIAESAAKARPNADSGGRLLYLHGLDAPPETFTRGVQAPAVEALRSALWKGSGHLLGRPLWIQEPEDEQGFVLQINAGVAPVNLGGNGSLFVFGDRQACFQC